MAILSGNISAAFKSRLKMLQLGDPYAHDLHDLDLYPGDNFYRRVIGKIDPLTGEIFIGLLSLVFKRHSITLDHQRVDEPLTGLALHMGSYLHHVGMNESRMFLQQFIGVGFHHWQLNKKGVVIFITTPFKVVGCHRLISWLRVPWFP